jgi:hypothetical protein
MSSRNQTSEELVVAAEKLFLYVSGGIPGDSDQAQADDRPPASRKK